MGPNAVLEVTSLRRLQIETYGAPSWVLLLTKPEKHGRRKNAKCHDDRPDPQT